MFHQIARCSQDAWIGIEILKRFLLFQAPGQHNRERSFVKLDSSPVWIAVDPKVLCEPAILLLSDSQVYQGSQRCLPVASRQYPASAIHHISSPNQVISPLILITLRLSPWNG